MPENDNTDERMFKRYARASWVNATRGARRYATGARTWARAEDIETEIKERDARALSARQQRDARARARKGRRALNAPSAPQRALTAPEVRTRALTTRAFRSALVLAAPAAVALYPPYALMQGDAGPLLLWPAAYGALAWNGWMNRSEKDTEDNDEQPADAEVPTKLFKLPQRSHGHGPKPTPEESAIISHVHAWSEQAVERRLQEVFPGTPVIDESGMLIPITFAGTWTPAKLDAQADQFRALLAVPDEVRTQFKPGGTADRALLRIRTRIRELDLTWTPEREGVGLDADTAEVVPVDITDRILIAGMSGAGKSVVLRVLMAEALGLENTVLVIIDLKVEGALWSHTARVESESDGIQQLVNELVEEMRERESIMRAQSLDTWEPTPERPRIVVVVDEGAELMSEVPDCVTGLRSIARRARSAEIPLWWATQKPTVTGQGRGLDSAISMQLTTQICLAVPSPAETRNVLGEDAGMKGWHAEDLQKGGWALVRVQGGDRAPDPVRVWFMTKEDVKALPARKAWRRESATAVSSNSTLAVALRLSEGRNGVATAQLAQELGITDTEVHARMRAYGVTPEPNAFALGDGDKARGYRRSVLQDAATLQEARR